MQKVSVHEVMRYCQLMREREEEVAKERDERKATEVDLKGKCLDAVFHMYPHLDDKERYAKATQLMREVVAGTGGNPETVKNIGEAK